MAALGKLVTMVTADTSGFRSGFARAGSDVLKFESTAKASLGNIKKMLVGFGAAVGVFETAKWAVGAISEMENLEVSFGTMLKSGEKAKAFMEDLNQFASVTPFETSELAAASKLLLAFGMQQKDIIPTMVRLGDVASALNIPLGELADLYGKMRVQGRLYAQDVNQLTGRGIPVIQEFAKQFGVADSAVRELVKDGKIGFAELEKAIVSLTGEGSMFGGGMAKQSQTLAGQWSTIKDNVKMIAVDLGGTILPILKDITTLTANLTDNIRGRGTAAADSAFEFLKNTKTIPLPSKGDLSTQLQEVRAEAAKLQADIIDSKLKMISSNNPITHVMMANKIKADRMAMASLMDRENALLHQSRRKTLDAFDTFNPEMHKMSEGITGFAEQFSNGLLAGADQVMHIKDRFAELKQEAKEYADRMSKMRDEAARIKEEVRGPLGDYLAAMDRLEELKKAGMLDQESFNRKSDMLRAEWMKDTEAPKDKEKAKEAAELGVTGIRDINRQIQLAAMGGKKKDEKNLEEINKKSEKLTKLETIDQTLLRMEKAKAFAFVG
jgi:tape measure domain-containing protein